MKEIRIFLVDDHQVIREGLRCLLEMDGDVRVVGEASDGQAALEQIPALAPDIVLMDIAMPHMNGVEATLRIRAESPRVQVIALSGYADKSTVLGILDAGARGFVLKSAGGEELLTAIREVSNGNSYLSPQVAGSLVESYVGRLFPTESSAYTLLGAREREVVQLLAEGGTSKEIAQRLHISMRTVEAHRRNIMRKLDLHSVAEVTKYALREGLTSLES